MPRTERKKSSTGIYHVMIRGINEQQLFEEHADYERFLSILAEVKTISGFKLFAYCLMGNHLHLLIKECDEQLSQILKRIGSRYVFWFNWKYGRSGHLFQDRFKSDPVESDEYFLAVLACIYGNPVKAGLCKQPEDYEWSSRKYLGNCELVDESELFDIIPLETVLESDNSGTPANCLMETKIGRKLAIPDQEVLNAIKTLCKIKSATEFQALDKIIRADVLVQLRKQGASIRQLARLTGMGKGQIESLSKVEQDYRDE